MAARDRLVLLAALALLGGGAGCRERSPDAGAARAAQHTPPLPEARRGAHALRPGRASPEALAEGARTRDPLERLAPPDHPSQRLAISRDRLAWLNGDELRVFSWPELVEVTRFPSPDARNVVALTGGGFLILAGDQVQRLSPHDLAPEPFPRAPRLGPTRVFPSRHESEQFWLYYAGVALVPRFDLGAPPRVASLPMLGWTELFALDRRAVLGLGDGSFVYTAPDGLRRIDVEGRREHLPSAELAGQIWALEPDARLDRVWAATAGHLYLVHVRERAELLRRVELQPHALAIASDAGAVAVLALERWLERDLGLRVDVYAPDAAEPLVLRLGARAPGTRDAAGSVPRLEPELALAHDVGLIAVNAFGLQVHDYRRGVRSYPP